MGAQSPIECVSFKGPYILEASFQTPRWQGLGEFRVIPIETVSSSRSRVQKGGICRTQSGQCAGMWVAQFQGFSGTLSSNQCKSKRKASPRGQMWSPRNGAFGDKKKEKRGACGGSVGEVSTFSSGQDPGVLGSSPALGSPLVREPASPSAPYSFSPALFHSLK